MLVTARISLPAVRVPPRKVKESATTAIRNRQIIMISRVTPAPTTTSSRTQTMMMSSSPSSNHDPTTDSDGNTSTTNTVNLFSLATSCLASSMAASEPIRRIALEAASFSSSCSSSSSSLHVSLSMTDGPDSPTTTSTSRSIASRSKSDGTVVTDADGAAQKIICDAIRAVNPWIRIVREESDEEENRLSRHGSCDDAAARTLTREEDWSSRSLTVEQALDQQDDDDDEEEDNKGKNHRNKTPVNVLVCWESICDYAHQQIQACVEAKETLLEHVDVDPNRVSVFVDPLDGTKNYAKGQFDAVSTLVAIVLDNTPVFGVICKPFGHCRSVDETNHNGTTPPCDEPNQNHPPIPNPHCFAVYGGTLVNGVYLADSNCHLVHQPVHIPQLPLEESKAVISSSRSGGIVQHICTELHSRGLLTKDPVLVSGAGEKALRLLIGTQGEALWPFPRSGTSLWDVAAADALLLSIGGCLTDKHGRPMEYQSAAIRGGSTDNVQGIIASNRKELHRACLEVFRTIEEEPSGDRCSSA